MTQPASYVDPGHQASLHMGEQSCQEVLYQVRAEIECMVSLLRRSREKRLREAGKMVENTLTNFSVNC